MTVTPSGEYSLPLYNLQTLLAASAAWQEWVGAANAEGGRRRIHLVAVDAAEALRPLAWIDQGDDWSRETEAGGARNHFKGSGTLKLWFEADVPKEYEDSHRHAMLWFMNKVGAIISEMEQLAGSGSYLCVHRFLQDDPPVRSREGEEDGDFIQVTFSIGWSF